MEDVKIMNNRISVDLDTMMKEAISKIKLDTEVKVTDYKIVDGRVELVIEGNDNNIAVLKDRFGIVEEDALTEDLAVNKLKRELTKLLDKMWKGQYSIKLSSMDNISTEMVHISFEVNLDTIPYPIRVSYHIAEDGYTTVSYSVFGDIEKDERWSATSITSKSLLEKISKIEQYYSVRHIEA